MPLSNAVAAQWQRSFHPRFTNFVSMMKWNLCGLLFFALVENNHACTYLSAGRSDVKVHVLAYIMFTTTWTAWMYNYYYLHVGGPLQWSQHAARKETMHAYRSRKPCCR